MEIPRTKKTQKIYDKVLKMIDYYQKAKIDSRLPEVIRVNSKDYERLTAGLKAPFSIRGVKIER